MKKYLTVENIFVVVVLVSGVLFAIINPFGQEPDGLVHFTRAMDVSYGNVFAPFTDNNGNGYLMNMPRNVFEVNFRVLEKNCGDAIAYMDHIKNMWFSTETIPMDGIGGFASLFYLPQAFGLFIARTLGLSVYGHMVWGRICNLMVYVILTYIGLRKMPIYKNIFLMITMLPITVYQAASFSYDAMLNALCFLFIGLCFNYAYEKEKLSWKDVIVLGIILGIIFMCKYVYVCIGLLVFIIPTDRFEKVQEYWKSFAIALIPFSSIVAIVVYSTSIVTAATETVVTTSDTQIVQMTQTGYILENPEVLIKAFLTTIPMYFSRYIDQISTFGWLNFELEPLRYLVPVFVCMVSLLDTNFDLNKVSMKDKMIFFITFVITVLAGMLGIYLMDSISNPVGSELIKGYQGRYVIPVLMLLLMLFANNKVENKIQHFTIKVVSVMSLFLMASIICLYVLCY